MEARRPPAPRLRRHSQQATMANFVGCKAVEHAISLGYVERDNVLSIDGVLYAQMVRM